MRSLVTIAIPTLDRASQLKETLRSLLSQTFTDFELIVVDNASADDTQAVIRSFGDPRIRCVRNERTLGMTENWNRCLELALAGASPYIAIFHSDDHYLPTLLEKEVAFLDRHPRVGLVHTALQYRDGASGRLKTVRPYPDDRVLTGPELFSEICRTGSYHITTPSVLARREAYEKAGRFDIFFRICPDVDLWWRMLEHYDIGFIAEPLMTQNLHGGQVSSSSHALAHALRQDEPMEALRRAADRLCRRHPERDRAEYERGLRDFGARQILAAGRAALLEGQHEAASEACRNAAELSPEAHVAWAATLLKLSNHAPGRRLLRAAKRAYGWSRRTLRG